MTDADYDPLVLPAAYFEGLPTGVPNNLPSQPEPVAIDCAECATGSCHGHMCDGPQCNCSPTGGASQ